jgi:hypothetical protein
VPSKADLKSAQESLDSLVKESQAVEASLESLVLELPRKESPETADRSREGTSDKQPVPAEAGPRITNTKDPADPAATARNRPDRNDTASGSSESAENQLGDSDDASQPDKAWRDSREPLLVEGEDSGAEWLFWIDVYSGLIIFLAYVVLYVITGILFLKWIYRTNRNLHAFSRVTMKYTPSWAVWSYFVPIANLFVPPAVMSELWAVSHKSTSGGLASLWWLFVIFSEVASRAFMTAMRKAKGFESLTSDRLFLFSLGGGLLAAVCNGVDSDAGCLHHSRVQQKHRRESY